jgi:hypothetical protein
VALTAVVLVGACGQSTPPSGTPVSSKLTPPPSVSGTLPAPTDGVAAASSAWEQVLTQIEPDGTVTAGTALQAFSLAFGPLPGVTVPAGPAGQIRSGSGALRWLVAHWAEITDEQRAEAVRLVPELGGIGGAASKAPRAPGPLASGARATARPPTYYAVLAQTLADEIEAQTHLHLDLTLFAAEGRTQNSAALADTGAYNAKGGTTGAAAKCVITLSELGAAELGAELELTIGHEVWHCYQAQIRGLDWYYAVPTPSWLVEGQAEWVGHALRPDAAGDWWREYIRKPGRTLFARSYDALGFYAHITQAQINTWDVLIPMLQADDDNVARYEASGATSQQFLDTWASGYFREPAVGPAWEFEGPGLPAEPAPIRLVLTVANGTTKPFSALAYANSIFSLSSSADIVTFDVEGHARLGDPGFRQEYVLTGGSYCTKAGGCTCPPGTEFAGAPPNRLSAETLLAVTGGQSGTQGTVIGHRLAEYCLADKIWSMVFWSPDLGDSAPPLLAAYTCEGLVSTWKVIYLPGGGPLERTFELAFEAGLTIHQDIHFDIPPDKLSNAQTVDYALDFVLDANADQPVIRVSGTKTEAEGAQSTVLQPREFGSDAPLVLKNVSLETQLAPYAEFQHPFRTQALEACGG